MQPSIAVAGGWGYIGQKFIQAACRLGWRVYVYDPSPIPAPMKSLPIEVFDDESRFYELPATLYHLALHPHHRRAALERLFARADAGQKPIVLCEKPMADPGNPEEGRWLLQTCRASDTIVLFDFIELFDDITLRVHQFLSQFRHVSLQRIHMWRSKDREDPSIPRNYKIMVPIQYQETVHCIAYVLSLFAQSPPGLEGAFAHGVRITGKSERYAPPNPEDYSVPVDGKVEGTIQLGETSVHLHTDFKSGALFTKRRTIEGIGDGVPFHIEAEHLEGRKYLIINGTRTEIPPDAEAYHQVIQRSVQWVTEHGGDVNANLRFPNTTFAWYTYQLSAMLWDSCNEGALKSAKSAREILNYEPGYPHHLREGMGE
ncbi:MAG: hypothetical protein AMXMBFR82_27210 [Candidatus Hydrogenedentota bacterium]